LFGSAKAGRAHVVVVDQWVVGVGDEEAVASRVVQQAAP
jgi:hypothetical protein